MKKINLLIFIAIATRALAQTWPSGAIPDPTSGQSGPASGEMSFRLSGQMLKDNPWTEKRGQLLIGLGLNDGLGVSLSASARDLSGNGTFQRGLGDSKLGLSYWPQVSDHVALGVNGYFIIPSGYRETQRYYTSATDTVGKTLPSFSLKQTGGELYAGAEWTISPIAALHGAAGYFATSDRSEQAFRWSLGAKLAPFGPRWTAELDYAESLQRKGEWPDADAFSAALVANVVWGFSVVGGVWADLDNKPLYGANVGLRMTIPVRGLQKTAKLESAADAALPPPLPGLVLVPPPFAAFPLVDQPELWESLQRAVNGRFETVVPLPTLDVPGLPYDDRTREQQQQSLRAVALAHPAAEWLLITHVEREDMARKGGLSMLLVTRPEWTAQCRVQVELVHLPDGHAQTVKVIEARATKPDKPEFAIMGAPEKEMLSMSESHDLALEVYREAGRLIAREVCHAQ
jgi:hypothetical protein